MWFKAHEAKLLSAVPSHLEIGYLQKLHVSVSFKDSIQALGRLLTGPAGSQIVELNIDNITPHTTIEERQNWDDPLNREYYSFCPVTSPQLMACGRALVFTQSLRVYPSGDPHSQCIHAPQVGSFPIMRDSCEAHDAGLQNAQEGYDLC